ncbi:hypothetical protein ACLKA7_005336 [Drosophila subpalustris]
MACNFVFDIVVTKYALHKIKLRDPKILRVEATFNRQSVIITSSRHNVTDFRNDARLEFSERPQRLRKELESCGLPFIVKNGAAVLGEGRMQFPQRLIDRIEENMTDLLHADSCTVQKNGELVGTFELLCRLVIKCADPTVEEDKVCRQNVDKSINPHDIMFLMGETQECPNPCDICPDVLDPEEGDERLQLDLQRYQSMNATWSPEKSLMPNSAGNAACFELKQMARDCEQIVDSITKSSGQPLKSNDFAPENPYARASSDRRVPTGPQEDTLKSPEFPNFTFLQPTPRESQVLCQPALMPVPISDLNKPDIKPNRFCPVCLTNMSWLPKFAACPKCGLKPTPILEERHKEKKLTAEQILFDYLGKPPPSGIEEICKSACEEKRLEEEKKEEQTECRCTCKFGKMCAHCRIRKLCADIFQTDEKRVCPRVKAKSSEDYCTIIEDSQQCRPYLSRVFSELRDLYNIKENQVQVAQDRICASNKRQSKTDPKEKEPKTKPAIIEKKPRLGHRHCVNERVAVSRHHGWDWKSSEESRKYGWRPGYILKPIKRLMKFFLQYLPEDNAFNVCRRAAQEQERQRQSLQPILNVCKKKGEIFITLRSAVNDPNIEMQPITFKIVKSERAVLLSEIKRRLKEKGFRKCSCHKSLMMCVCRNHMEKRQLFQALQRECHRRGVENCVNQLVLTDTSDSEMEYDFDVSPEAGTVKPPGQPKRRQINHGTQTSRGDQKVQPKYPKPRVSPYFRAYDCAAGDRYRDTAFGDPGEDVYEDGVFGLRGGGAHGAGGSRGPGGHGGRGPRGSHGTRGGHGPGGSFGIAIPAAKSGGKKSSAPIPVKMPKRFQRKFEAAKKAKEEAELQEELKRKRGINMMKYLQQHDAGTGSISGTGKGKGKGQPVTGPDGLTDVQRRRRALREVCLPSIDDVPRRGKGPDPCAAMCYNPCAEWYF